MSNKPVNSDSDTLVYYYVIAVSYAKKNEINKRNIREVLNSSKCKIQSMPLNLILAALKNYQIY